MKIKTEKVGENLRNLREKKGLSQAALARLIGTQRQRVTEWETGTKVPSLESLVKLAEALDTSTNSLVKGVIEKP